MIELIHWLSSSFFGAIPGSGSGSPDDDSPSKWGCKQAPKTNQTLSAPNSDSLHPLRHADGHALSLDTLASRGLVNRVGTDLDYSFNLSPLYFGRQALAGAWRVLWW